MVYSVMMKSEDGHESEEEFLTAYNNGCIALVTCNQQRQNKSPGMSTKDRESRDGHHWRCQLPGRVVGGSRCIQGDL